MAWRIDIKDKIVVKGKKGEGLYCPPHCIPHKVPFTKPITDESCHYHKARWRMAHHIPFCFLVRYKNYKRMMQKYGQWNRSKK